ncbi:MAG: DUF2490 domain-containing protein [Gammaproteobacteria bacterium]|nr:DUF2490 domain-containing protein [Gammaproteobacteria bacterium]
MKKITAALLLLAVVCPVWAAEDEAGLWVTGSVSTALAEHWRAALDIQPRFIDGVDTLERVVLRPSISRRINDRLALTLGYDAHLIESPEGRVEQRLWQQAMITGSSGVLKTHLRIRIEERFIEDVDSAAVRGRFRAGVKWPTGFSFFPHAILRNEIFFNLNAPDRGPDTGFDQNRFFAGFARQLAENLDGELGYQMQYIDRNGREDLAVHQAFVGLSMRLD